MEKVAIVAGNGPSLKQIDYTRLPKDFDVFRANLFFAEDKYYLGDKVKFATSFMFIFFEYYYTLCQLQERAEYKIENPVCTMLDFLCVRGKNRNFKENFKVLFPDAINILELEAIKKFLTLTTYRHLYESEAPAERTGIFNIALAASLGYKKIYLVGYDLYQKDKDNYAFDITKTKNFNRVLGIGGGQIGSGYEKKSHSNETDLKALEFIKSHYGVELFSLCPATTLVNNIASLAPQVFHYDESFIKPKPQNYIKDFCIPQKHAYKKFKNICMRPELEANLYFKLIKDFVSLPSLIKHYLRNK